MPGTPLGCRSCEHPAQANSILNERPLVYECHHQRKVKTMRGAKSNALFSRTANRNPDCPRVALVIFPVKAERVQCWYGLSRIYQRLQKTALRRFRDPGRFRLNFLLENPSVKLNSTPSRCLTSRKRPPMEDEPFLFQPFLRDTIRRNFAKDRIPFH